MQLIPDDTVSGLGARVFARFSARLDGPSDHPIAVGLSGGGDSLALLALTCEWASLVGRKVLALTVDHRLNPQSRQWTQRAGQMAHALGADWQPLVWTEARGGSAIQERARMARHTLLAQAARQGGASMLLLGHTANDVAENQWMRTEGTAVGSLRELSPSPVWPQGRGVTLLRPLLAEGREPLRQYLRDRGLSWIDDPANMDPNYARIRARQALGGAVAPLASPLEPLLADPGPLADAGVIAFSRAALAASSSRTLAVALLCGSGTSVPPRGEKLAALMERVRSDESHVSVLCGARIEMDASTVRIFREGGEQRRSGLVPLSLVKDQGSVWDGRFEFTACENGWQVCSADGNLARLSDEDRQRVSTLPVAARISLPLLHNTLTGQYVLSSPAVRIFGLCGRRYRATTLCLTDETTQEGNLFDLWHGETGPTALFSI